MYTIGYDFGDTWMEFGGWRFAIRLSTQGNLYAPNPEKTQIVQRDGALDMQADGLCWAGGQRTCDGRLALRLCKAPDGTIRVTGSAEHSSELCRTLVLLVKGMDIKALIGESDNMPSFPLTRFGDAGLLEWPGRTATMPLVFIDCGDRECFALSRDTRVRRKAFSAYWDHVTDEPVLILAHDEDARARSQSIDLPNWEIGECGDRADIIRRRFSDLETHFGMRPFARHPERQWVDEIRLVVNLHGMHWTGHVFMTYQQQADALRVLTQSMAGKHILAFLPAWEGSYYRTSPVYGPADELGGADGLRTLVDTAHELGVRIIPMLDGPNLATDSYLTRNNLRGAILRDAAGDPMPQSWVDWDSDLSREKMGWIVNFGHPELCRRMVELSCSLIEQWGFDGIFMDGAIRWENSPNYSAYEGIAAWGKAVQDRCPHALLMAEDGYDLLWDVFGLFATSMQPLGLEQAMLRYTRQSYYLAYPAPGGSGGVHEQAWHSRTKNDLLSEYIIPTLALVGDTLERHAEAVDLVLQSAKRRRVKMPAFVKEDL